MSSTLSSLISYSDDDDGDDLPQLPVKGQADHDTQPPQQHTTTPPTPSSTPPGLSTSSSSASVPSPPSPSSSSPSLSHADSSASAPSPHAALATAAALLPPLDPPPPASSIASFLTQFPSHLSSLLSKKRSLPPSTPSLYAQLLALPSFHNPYIYPRLLAKYSVDPHTSLHSSPLIPDDSLASLTAQAEAETTQRRQREEAAEEARLADLRRREGWGAGEAKGEQAGGGGGVEGDTRQRKRKQGWDQPVSAPTAPAPPPPAPAPPPVTVAAGGQVMTAEMETKRQEALRRVQEITKRHKL